MDPPLDPPLSKIARQRHKYGPALLYKTVAAMPNQPMHPRLPRKVGTQVTLPSLQAPMTLASNDHYQTTTALLLRRPQ